jgi:tetratricopeptide (TPR) repeat protein
MRVFYVRWPLADGTKSERGKVFGRCRAALVAILLVGAFPLSTPAAEAPLAEQFAAARDSGAKWEAIELLQRMIIKDGESEEKLRELAGLRIEVGDVDRAREAIEKLTAKGAKDLHVLKGRLAMADGERAEAINEWGLAADSGGADASVLTDLVRALLYDNVPTTDALKRSEQLLALGKTPEALMYRCRARLLAREWQGAYDDCVAANEMDAANSDVRSWFPSFERLGGGGLVKLAMLEKTGDRIGQARILTENGLSAAAAAILDGVITDKTPEAGLRLFYAGVLSKAGQTFRGAGLRVIFQGNRIPLAPEKLAKIEEIDGTIKRERTAESFFLRAWNLNECEQFLMALDDCKSALDLKPDDPRALTEGAYASMRLDRLDDAYAMIAKATEQPSPNANMWRMRGDIEIALARHEAAVASYEKSLALENSDVTRARLTHTKLIAAPK